MMEAAQRKSRNERTVLGAARRRPTGGGGGEAGPAAICRELSERLQAIGNYVQAACRQRVIASNAASVPRHVAILVKALGQVNEASRAIAQLRKALPAKKSVAMLMTQNALGPAYRVHFVNEFARASCVTRACQRTIPIRSARSPERAVEAAKKRFARAEHIPDWRIHAQMIELEIVGAETGEHTTLR